MSVPFLTAYGKHKRSSIAFPSVGKTKQAFREECDINNIMKKFQATGVADFVNKRSPQYGDCTGVDFQAAMDTIISANEMFDELPSSIRKHFNNDPAQLLDAVNDPARRSECVALGLIQPSIAEVKPSALPAGSTAKPATAGTTGKPVTGSGGDSSPTAG